MGGRRGFFVGSVALVALVVGLASGCSGAQGASGPDASPSVSATSSLTPSASSTATPTLDDEARAKIPKAARAHTAKGAEAFARFYLEQVNMAWMVPDPELIRPYALESCKTCANYVATSVWLRQHALKYATRPSTVGVSAVLPESTDDRVLVQVVNNQEKANIVEVDGTIHKTMPHIFAGSQVELRWSHGVWTVRGVKAVL